jgi:hypothetical protein
MIVRLACIDIAATALVLLPGFANARFLQADPVGYKADPNLYVYVGNDPLNQLDPTGLFANVKVWDDGVVEINVPIAFDNQSADPQAANAAAQDISSRWTGTFGAFKAQTSVTQMSAAQNAKCGCANMVTITDTATPTTKTPSGNDASNGGHSYVIGDFEGHWTTMDTNGTAMPMSSSTKDMGVASKGGDTFAHEGGHLMGVADEKGDSGGIMDQGRGVTPSESNIRSIVNSPGNSVQQCSRKTGQCGDSGGSK